MAAKTAQNEKNRARKKCAVARKTFVSAPNSNSLQSVTNTERGVGWRQMRLSFVETGFLCGLAAECENTRQDDLPGASD
jgi:hypothetical protein